MTVQGALTTAAAETSDALRDWEELRKSGDIQFAPVPQVAPPERPGWLQALGQWLQDLFAPLGELFGNSWPIIQNILIALGVVLALVVLWALLSPLVEKWMNRRAGQQVTDWAPGREAAAALLEDADRLADEGRFAEAVHLLLQRSVHHIRQARPDWLLPASTAREIAAFPMLPIRAKSAFAAISGRVEKSMFALRGLDENDWQVARAAYAEFALEPLSGVSAPA